MSEVIVLGGGVCGLTAAMLLARDGHDVTVLERDADAVPESAEVAWERWRRAGVTQFRQAHYLQPAGRAALEEALPDVSEAIEAAGGLRFDVLGLMPPWITDRAPRPGDERFATLTARRPSFELAFARAAQAEPRLVVRRGTGVRELLTERRNGTPHVAGVRTEGGEELRADLVVDAMGRRSPLPQWLVAAGVQAPSEEGEDSGFVYYTRFFRSRDGGLPPMRGPLLMTIGSFSILTLPADDATWSVTVFTASGDQPLKRLRHADPWTAVVAACPLQAPWLEGEAMTDVLAMGGVVDRRRSLTVDGRPVATGVALVGDAWACTNPSLGRGMTFGILHARRLVTVLRDHEDDPAAFAAAWDTVTEEEFTPWYEETVAEDRASLARIRAARAGEPAPPPGDGPGRLRAALAIAGPHDPDLFRAFLETRCCYARTGDVLARPGVAERAVEVASGLAAPPPMGPDRQQLLRLLA